MDIAIPEAGDKIRRRNKLATSTLPSLQSPALLSGGRESNPRCSHSCHGSSPTGCWRHIEPSKAPSLDAGFGGLHLQCSGETSNCALTSWLTLSNHQVFWDSIHLRAWKTTGQLFSDASRHSTLRCWSLVKRLCAFLPSSIPSLPWNQSDALSHFCPQDTARQCSLSNSDLPIT